jgi:hypothetical protein
MESSACQLFFLFPDVSENCNDGSMMIAEVTISKGASGNVGVISGVGVASASSIALAVAYMRTGANPCAATRNVPVHMQIAASIQSQVTRDVSSLHIPNCTRPTSIQPIRDDVWGYYANLTRGSLSYITQCLKPRLRVPTGSIRARFLRVAKRFHGEYLYFMTNFRTCSFSSIPERLEQQNL